MRPIDQPPVVVFDLDGTILRCNSFPRWVRHLITGRLPVLSWRQRLGLSLDAMALLVRRKLGRMSHDAFMRRLQGACQPLGTAAMNGFAASLLRQLRPNLTRVLELVREGQIDAVLATAAAAEYADWLGARLGFRHVVASPAGRGDNEPINIGEHKLERVQSLLAREGWQDRRLILLTDHHDDLPLIRVSDVVCWFGAGNLADPPAGLRLLTCRNLDAAAMHATLFGLYFAPNGGTGADQANRRVAAAMRSLAAAARPLTAS